jgi:hypothetical protein
MDIDSPTNITYNSLLEEYDNENRETLVVYFPFITFIRKVIQPSTFILLSFSAPLQFAMFTVTNLCYMTIIIRALPYKS